MESVVTHSQPADITFNATPCINNATLPSGDFDWDSWWMEMNMNPVYKAAMFIKQNYLFILSGIGVPCNMLSFLVLWRIQPLTSALLIMMLLAVADSLNLMVEVANRGMQMIHISFSNIGCCILITARYLVQYMPIWLVVLLTLERVVAVCFPMKASQVCTISNARRSTFILVILDVFICIVHTFIYEAKGAAIGSNCHIKLKYLKLHDKFVVVDGLCFVIIPLILISFFNILIIIKLRISTGIHSEAIGCSVTEENKRQNRSVTVMLLAVSITTIICLGPNLVMSLYGNKWDRSVNVVHSTYARQRLTISIIYFLTCANNAVNLFLYILSGRRFRSELHGMVSSWFGNLTHRL